MPGSTAMNTPTKANRVFAACLDVLEDGLDLKEHMGTILSSPSPRHLPLGPRFPSSLPSQESAVSSPRSRSRSPVSHFSAVSMEQLEQTLMRVLRNELQQFKESGPKQENCEDGLASVSLPKPPNSRPGVGTLQVHDLQVLRTDSAILSALDGFWAKFSSAKLAPRANITVVFEPYPPITNASALHQRMEAALGIRVMAKGTVSESKPYGVMGGQKGQPCVVLHFKDSHKLTVQVQARKGNVVVKGRKQAFAPQTIRALLPFLGNAVLVQASSAE